MLSNKNLKKKPNKQTTRNPKGIRNLSVFGVAALGGFAEELQERRPAVRGLVFDHDGAQLGERVLHGVPATRRARQTAIYLFGMTFF